MDLEAPRPRLLYTAWIIVVDFDSNVDYCGAAGLVVTGGEYLAKINYDLFYKIVCGAKVPIVIIATGLENEDNMEDWWADNVREFHDRGMCFSGHAYITTTRGKVEWRAHV